MSQDGPQDLDRSFVDRVMRAVLWAEQYYGQGTAPTNDGASPAPPPCIGFLNGLGQTVPAYGVCVVTSATPDASTPPYGWARANVAQPSVHGGGSLLAVNEPSDVASGASGLVWFAPPWWPQWALYDGDTGSGGGNLTPAVGETWGPMADSFKLFKGLPGFTVLAVDTTNSRVLVVRTEGDNEREALIPSGGSGFDSGGGVQLKYRGAALTYGGSPLTVAATDDMLNGSTIPAGYLMTVAFWPHEPGWHVVNAEC